MLVKRSAVNQSVLKLAAAWIGRLYQKKQSFLLFLTDINKRLHAINAKIRINRHKILAKARIHIRPDLHLTQMCRRICRRGRTNITALNITNDNQPFFLTIIDRSLKHRKSWNPKLLIHRNLRLYRRNQIVNIINNFLIKKPNRFCRPLKRLALFFKRRFLDMLWYKLHHRVEPHDNRRTRTNNQFNQLVYHRLFLYFSFNIACCLYGILYPCLQKLRITPDI